MNTEASYADSIGARIAQALEQCQKLQRLLEEEFEALRSQDLKSFESLQQPKAALVSELTAAVAWQQSFMAEQQSAAVLAAWESFRVAMLESRDLHRRNELLILRKRDAVRGALEALVGGLEATSSVDVYDRLGRMNRPGRRRSPYAQA